jgi:hypothetical protein
MRKIAAGAASDLEHAVAWLGVHTSGGARAQVWREKEQPIEQADQARNTIVTLRDERAFTVHPMMSQSVSPHMRAAHWFVDGAAA